MTLPLLPPVPHPLRATSADALSNGQRRAAIAAIVLVHGVAGWAAWQVPAVREAVAEAAPIFVQLIAPETPPPLPEPAPPPRPLERVPLVKRPPPPTPLITAAAAPAPAAFTSPPPELPPPIEAIEPAAPPAPPVAVVTEAPPAAPAPPPPAPKVIPASAVQYLEAPTLEYPRLSRRARESGRVMVRVYIDEAGLPRTVQVSTSSGHARLDEAAVAAVMKARFKPYTENGRPTPGWAYIPLDFDLEK